MTQPKTDGWLIDYRAARAIFVSGDNSMISHVLDLCNKNLLFISHCEEDLFGKNSMLAPVFVSEVNRVYEPDSDIFSRCEAIASDIDGKPAFPKNDTPIFLVATALAKNFGIVSNHISPSFATACDYAERCGVLCLTSDQYKMAFLGVLNQRGTSGTMGRRT